MSKPEMNPEAQRIEAALASLAPAPAQLDRDEVMHAAGLAAANRRAARYRSWSLLSTAALLFVSTGFAYLAATRPEPIVVKEVVYAYTNVGLDGARVEQKSQTPPAQAASHDHASELHYLRLRDQVLTHGIDSLPDAPIGGGNGEMLPPLRAGSRELLEELYGT